MKKLLVVAGETYWRQIKSWSFVLMILAPFFITLLSLGVGYLSEKMAAPDPKVSVLSSDPQIRQAVRQELKKSKIATTSQYKNLPAARQAARKDKIAGYLVIKEQKGKFEFQYASLHPLDNREKQTYLLLAQKFQLANNFQQAQLTPAQLQAIRQQPTFRQRSLQMKNSVNKDLNLISFMVLLFIMYTILLIYSTITAQEIASEKGTKIMEIIFSSTTAMKYFLGKLAGIAGVILTQIAVYILGGYLLYNLIPQIQQFRRLFRDNQHLIDQVVHNFWSWNLVYLVFGVLIYIVLSALCGALVTRPEDANKAVQPAMYLVMFGFFAAIILSQQPENLIVKILSYIPFLSSFFMPIRIINQTASTGENLISLALLVVSLFLMVLYIGRIYAGLILQTEELGLFKSLKRGLTIK
ncbi:ABC transporter permease [Lactobacillus sp. DCY120]|uniref:ABC transporter permease n=1 Tax=Bombilactobacillus apium TaxID=2675299 RepID=A0A850R0X3_9LACO|nr:ABC transporter permease [Bombilactobacillus apium]NVY96729.1 ABC transporter permease [Bombilactobacillus apium]